MKFYIEFDLISSHPGLALPFKKENPPCITFQNPPSFLKFPRDDARSAATAGFCRRLPQSRVTRGCEGVAAPPPAGVQERSPPDYFEKISP